MRSTGSGWQWSRSAREPWVPLNILTQPVSQLVVGDFVGQSLSDVVRDAGGEWQVSEAGTAPWRTLYRGAPRLSGARFGDFVGDARTDAFFADGSMWTVVEGFPNTVTHRYPQPFTLAELRFGNFVGDAKTDVLRWTGTGWTVWEPVSQPGIISATRGFRWPSCRLPTSLETGSPTSRVKRTAGGWCRGPARAAGRCSIGASRI